MRMSRFLQILVHILTRLFALRKGYSRNFYIFFTQNSDFDEAID
jgi:hypothetical protein